MQPHRILIASNNAHKLQEMREIIALAGATEAIRLITPHDLGLSLDPEETADTYSGNALLKARAFAAAVKDLQSPEDLYILADDSGLEVDALGGRPGVLSARFHKTATGGDGCAALLAEMADVPDDERTARFRCVIALIGPDKAEALFEGVCEGRIGHEKRGMNGFGFDPVFVPAGGKAAMAELPPGDKHRISHRGIVVRRIVDYVSRLP